MQRKPVDKEALARGRNETRQILGQQANQALEEGAAGWFGAVAAWAKSDRSAPAKQVVQQLDQAVTEQTAGVFSLRGVLGQIGQALGGIPKPKGPPR